MPRHVAYESSNHLAYKKVAIDLLKERKFNPLEIEEEANVKCDGVTYIVDVVGTKGNHKVAIECGHADSSKILNLRKNFDEVIIINPETLVQMYDSLKSMYFDDVGKLQRELEHLKGHAEWVCNDANSRIEKFTEEIKKLKNQNQLVQEVEMLKGQVQSLTAKLRKYQKVAAEAWRAIEEQS